MIEKEKKHNKMLNSDIIQTCFSYAIILNNINVALYLFQKFKRSFTEKTEGMIDSILHILNEYTESNGAEKYKRGISHLEELLYFLDLFSGEITANQSYYLLRIFYNFLQARSLDDEEFEKLFEEKIK